MIAASDGVAFLSLMADAPKVSVVMPVRDAAGTLPVALASVRGQTFADWELLVVDDGSKDETAVTLASVARADPRIRVISQSAFGIAENCNLDALQLVANLSPGWMPTIGSLQSGWHGNWSFLSAIPSLA